MRKDLLAIMGPAWAVVVDAEGRVTIVPNPYARPKPNLKRTTEQVLSRIVFEPKTG